MVAPAKPPFAVGDGPATQRVANRPIICHALDALAATGIDALAILAPGPAMSGVQRCVDGELASGLEITYLPQGESVHLLGALDAATAFVGEDAAVVHFADGLLAQPLDACSAVLNANAPDLLLLLHRTTDRREQLAPATEKLLGITELNGSRNRLALAGICLFGPGGLRRSVEAARNQGPPAGDLISIAERLAARGQVVEAAFVHGWQRYAGDPLDLVELNGLVLDQMAPNVHQRDQDDNRIEGRVVVHPSAEIRASVVLGPTIIGADAKVTNSYIGPYTSIGARAEIEDAEVVRSIISEGVRITHVSDRIEASTIGRDASIFCDFRLPRALRLHVGDGVEIALN